MPGKPHRDVLDVPFGLLWLGVLLWTVIGTTLVVLAGVYIGDWALVITLLAWSPGSVVWLNRRGWL